MPLEKTSLHINQLTQRAYFNCATPKMPLYRLEKCPLGEFSGSKSMANQLKYADWLTRAK